MSDKIDDMIRQASGIAPGPRPKPPGHTRVALFFLIGLAALLIAVPLILALTGQGGDDLLWDLATGDPRVLISGDQ